MCTNPNLVVGGFTRFLSVWWKDLRGVGFRRGVGGNWMVDGVCKRLGDVRSILFWKDKWFGGSPLQEIFPRLFVVSSLQDEAISAFGRWEDGAWVWDFKWRRNLFVWEELLLEFCNFLSSVFWYQTEDSWGLKLHPSGTYVVKSVYDFLINQELQQQQLSDLEVKAFNCLWKSHAPLKVVAFSWQLLLDRLPTRLNTFKWKVLGDDDDLICVFCSLHCESALHLFLCCPFISSLWSHIFFWLGEDFPYVDSMLHSFVFFVEGCNSRVNRGDWLLLWHSTIWCIYGSFNMELYLETTKQI